MKSLLFAFGICAVMASAIFGYRAIRSENRQMSTPDPVATRLNPEANPIYPSAFHNLSFSPDGKLLAIGQGTGAVQLWNTGDWQHRQTIKAHDQWAFSVIFSTASNRLFTGGGDDLIKIWDLESPAFPSRTLTDHGMDIHALALTPDETRLVSAGDDRVPLVWDLDKRSVALKLAAHPRQVTSIAVSPDGKYVGTGSRDSQVRLFDLASGELLFELDDHEKDVMSVRFSPDGELIASASYDGCICIWDVDMGYLVEKRSGHRGAAVCLDFSPDGKELVSVDHERLTFLNVDNLKSPTTEFQPELEEGEQMSFVRYSPDGRQIAVATTAARFLVIDARSKQQTHSLPKRQVASAEEKDKKAQREPLPRVPDISPPGKSDGGR